MYIGPIDLYFFITIRRPANKKYLIFIADIICTISRNTVIIKIRTIGCRAKLKIPVAVGDHSVTYKGTG